MAGQVFNYSLKFNADSAAATQAINQLQASLLEIQKKPLKLAVDQSSFTEAAKAAQELSMHLSNATDANTGKLNVNQLSASLKKAGTDLTQLSAKLLEIGPSGAQAFTQLSSAIASSNTPLKQMNSTLKSLGVSLANTAKWQLSSSLVHGFIGGLQSALNYAKDLNKSLTDIRIVTGYSTEQMAKFAEQANKAAKNLATTTTGYTNAALIYYQQGNSDAEVAKKAEITLKAANAAFGASAKEMSEYLTAVWNSYQVGADELERYVDIMAALGAKTATSLEEIATSMQKVAATSNAVGVSMEQVSSIISTVSSVTRESAESIGTSFKTIFARMGDLKLGETLEDGIKLGQVSSQLAKIGVNILDVNGQMRDMGTVIEELMAKWEQLSTAEQVATAQVVAGKRQYTQLLALMENRDMYQKNMQIAENSAGFTNKQAEIYKESWAAASKEVRASLEGMWGQLIDDKTFIKATKGIAGFVSEISRLIKNMGGFKSALTLVGAALMNLYSPQIATKIDSMAQSLTKFFTVGKAGNQQQQFSQNIKALKQQLAEAADNTQYTNSQKVSMEFDLQILELKERLANASKTLSKTQIQGAESVIGSLQAQKQIFVELYEAYEKAQAKVEATSQSMVAKLTDEELYKNAARYQGLTDRGAAAKANQNLAIDAKKAYLQSGAQKEDPNLGANIKTLNDLNTAMSKMDVAGFSATLQGLGGNLKNAGIAEMVNIFNELSTSVANAKRQAAEFGQSFKDIANSSRTTEQLKGDLLKFAQEANLTEEEIKQLKTELQTITTNADLDAWARKGGNAFELLKTKMDETSSATSPLVSYMRILRNILAQKFSPAALKELDDVLASLNSKTVNLDANIKKAGDDINKNFNKALQPASGFARIVSSLSSVLMTINSAISSITNMINVWKDSDSTYWDKLSATLTAVGTAFMFVNTMSMAVTTISDVIKTKKMAEAAAWMASGAAATAAGEAAGKATYKALGWIGAIILAVMAVVALLHTLFNALNREAEALTKLKESTEELGSVTTVAFNRISKAINVMSKMQSIINDTTLSYREQKDALQQLTEGYGIAVDIMDVMNKSYSVLETDVSRAIGGTLEATITDLDAEVKDATAAYDKIWKDRTIKITDKSDNGSFDFNSDVLTTTESGTYIVNNTHLRNFQDGFETNLLEAGGRSSSASMNNTLANYYRQGTDFSYGAINVFNPNNLINWDFYDLVRTPTDAFLYSDWFSKHTLLRENQTASGESNYQVRLPDGTVAWNGPTYSSATTLKDLYATAMQIALPGLTDRSGFLKALGVPTEAFYRSSTNALVHGRSTVADIEKDYADGLNSIDLSMDGGETLAILLEHLLATNPDFSRDFGQTFSMGKVVSVDTGRVQKNDFWGIDWLAADSKIYTTEHHLAPENIEAVVTAFANKNGAYNISDDGTITFDLDGKTFSTQLSDTLVTAWKQSGTVLPLGPWIHESLQTDLLSPIAEGSTEGTIYSLQETGAKEFADKLVQEFPNLFEIDEETGEFQLTSSKVAFEDEEQYNKFKAIQTDPKYASYFAEDGFLGGIAINDEQTILEHRAAMDTANQNLMQAKLLQSAFTNPESGFKFLQDTTEKTLGELLNTNLTLENEDGTFTSTVKDLKLPYLKAFAGLLTNFDNYALAATQLDSLITKSEDIAKTTLLSKGVVFDSSDTEEGKASQQRFEKSSEQVFQGLVGLMDDAPRKLTTEGQKGTFTITADVLLQLNPTDVQWTEDAEVTVTDKALEAAYWASESLKIETQMAAREANKEFLTQESYSYDDYLNTVQNKALISTGVLSEELLKDPKAYQAAVQNYMSKSQQERSILEQELAFKQQEDLLASNKAELELLQRKDASGQTDFARAQAAFQTARDKTKYTNAAGQTYDYTGAVSRLGGLRTSVTQDTKIKEILQSTDDANKIREALRELELTEEEIKAYVKEDENGKLTVVDGALGTVAQRIATNNTEIANIEQAIQEAEQAEKAMLRLQEDERALQEQIDAGTYAINTENKVRFTNRATAFTTAYNNRSNLTMDELEILSIYAGDQKDALLTAYQNTNDDDWNAMMYSSAENYYNKLAAQYLAEGDMEKYAVVLQQKEALTNTYYSNLKNQALQAYNYEKSLMEKNIEDQKEKVDILKELTKENAKLTDAQRKNLEQAGISKETLATYDAITDAQAKQLAGTKMYIKALGDQALAEQTLINKQKEGIKWSETDAQLQADALGVDTFYNERSLEWSATSEGMAELTAAMNGDAAALAAYAQEHGVSNSVLTILQNIQSEANGAELSYSQIIARFSDKMSELDDAGEDVWANFRTYAAEALTSVIAMEQSVAQETVTVWTSAYKAIATAREGAMSGKTILESLYGDEQALIAMIGVLNKGTYADTVTALTESNPQLNGLNGMIDRTAYGKSLGLGGSIFATNRDATQDQWWAQVQAEAEASAMDILGAMDSKALYDAYGYMYEEVTNEVTGEVTKVFYKATKDANGNIDKALDANKQPIQITSSDLAASYINSVYGAAGSSQATKAYNSQRNQYWAQDLIARQQATAYRASKVTDYYSDMDTLDKIGRGERATDAAGIAREVALLNSLGNNITAERYVTASPTDLASWTSTSKREKSNLKPEVIDNFGLTFDEDDLYTIGEDGKRTIKAEPGLGRKADGSLSGFKIENGHLVPITYEDRYKDHLQRQGLTSTDYTYEQYLRDYHGDKTFMTEAEKAAYDASKKHYDDKKAIDDTLKPYNTAKTQLQELSELDLSSADTEDNWNAIADSVEAAGGALKDWDEYNSASERKTALLKADIAVAEKEAEAAETAYTTAKAKGLTEEEIEQYRQKWMQAEADVAANKQELESQNMAIATAALDAQIAKWQELETAINSASSTLSSFLSDIESWGSASFATIAQLEADIATINKLAGTNIQYTGFTGNAATDRDNMLRMNLDVNKANAQLLTQEQNFIQGITSEMTSAMKDQNRDMIDAFSGDTWMTDLAGMKDRAGNAFFTDAELAKMSKAREEALKLNKELSGVDLWNEVQRILGEEDIELGVKLKVNEGQRKDLWKQMLSDQIAQEEAAAAEIVSVWENAFQAILKAKETLASGKSIGEMLLGDKDQMTALISMLRAAGYEMEQIYDILNSPEEIGGWTSKISELTTQQRADKYGASHENLLYNTDGTLASDQGTYAKYRERVEADVRAEATDAYLISLLGAAKYERIVKDGKTETDEEYQARIQAALTEKGDTVSTVTVEDGVITFTGDAGDALDNTVAEKMLAVTEKSWSQAFDDMMYEEFKTVKNKEASELAEVNNRIAHENEIRTYAIGDKQYTEEQIKAYNQAFTTALEEYDASGNLEGLDTESKKLLQEYFGLDSLAEVEDLSLSQLETGATTTADAMYAAAAAALAYADAQYAALGYTKDGNGQWSKTVNSKQYDAWYATNGAQYKDNDAAARAAFDKEQWDTWYAKNKDEYESEAAAKAAYLPMPSQMTIGLDETSQQTYDTLSNAVNTTIDGMNTAETDITGRALRIAEGQLSALSAMDSLESGTAEWAAGIDALRESYAGLDGAQKIIDQLADGTITLGEANDQLVDYTLSVAKNVGKMTDAQWKQYKQMLRNNNVTIDGYETLDDYFKHVEKVRTAYKKYDKSVEKAGKAVKKLNGELKDGNGKFKDFLEIDDSENTFSDAVDGIQDDGERAVAAMQWVDSQFEQDWFQNALKLNTDEGGAAAYLASFFTDSSGKLVAASNELVADVAAATGLADSQIWAFYNALAASCNAAGGSLGGVDWGTLLPSIGIDWASVIAAVLAYNDYAAEVAAASNGALNPNRIPMPGGGAGGGGTTGNRTPSGGGGGGGGGGDPKKLDKKRGRDEIERYHYLEKQLERVAEKLEEIDKIKERTFGKKHLDAIDDEIAALEKETKIQEAYLKEAETRYKNLDTKRMERLGGEFDEDGNLKNYEDVMKGLIDEYNAFITKYNDASADEQKNMEEEKKRMDKWFEDQKQFLENYEETIKIINEKKNELEELKNKKSAAELEKITYKIEVITEFNDKDIEILEYYQSLYEDNLDLQGDFVRNLTQTSQEYVQNFSAISQAKADLDQKYKDGKITQADYIEGLQQLQESSLEYASAIEEVKKQMEEAYGNTLELAQDEMDKHNDALEHSSNLISSYISIMQLLGKGPNYTKLREFYQYQHAANLENIKTQRLWLETWEKEALYYEQKGTLTELEQKQYEELQEKIRESREELVSSTEEALSALQEAYENSINAIFKTLDENLGGAYDSLTQVAELYGYYQEKQANYVSTAKELHEISKLNRDIENSLEDVLTTTSKERLKALQQEINLISERNKLTEYDIEMMNLQYQLALAQIALEEAQASKDTVRLTRDEDGNMAYQYTADASKVSEAQQQYEDILQQINDLSANRVSELEQQFLEIQQNYRDTAQEILLDTNLTEEEKVAKLAALAEHSKNQMNYIQEQYGNASKHLMENQAAIAQQYGQSLIDTTDATSRQMNEMLANMIQNTQAQVELFDKAISGEGLEAFRQYLADIGVVLNTSGTSENGLPGAAQDASDAAKEAAESADETAKKINSATAAVHAATEEWLKHAGALDSVRDSYVAIAEAIQKIVAAESGFSSDEGMAGIWEGTEDLAERQAQIIKQQQELLKNAQETIDTQIETEIINGKHLEDIGAAYEEHLNKIANTQADSNENITSTLLNQSEYLAIQESFVSQLSELLSGSNLQNMYGNATASILGFNGTNNGLIQQIELHADFSAAESAAEIKEALELFVQTASQYAYSTDRAPTAF